MAGKAAQKREENEALLTLLEARANETLAQLRQQKARRLSTAVAKDQLFIDQLKVEMAKIITPVTPSSYAVRAAQRKPKIKRALNLKLSDLHFGAALDQRELPLQYGFVEEARRLGHVVRQAIEYKYDHRAETTLNLHLIGDMIQGQLHDKRDGKPLAEQICDCQWLLTQAVERLSEHFPWVSVYCTPGNHGRNKDRHNDRATSEKFDAHETGIYHAVKLATRNLPNVRVSIPRTPWYAWESFGEWGFGTHGDTVFTIGYPGSNIDVKKARAEVNKINTARTYGGRKYMLFISGHVHTSALVQLPNGPTVMTNGALIPADGYSVSRGEIDQECCQNMWESTPGFILGDFRPIKVNEKTDRDSSLDKLILPFKDF